MDQNSENAETCQHITLLISALFFLLSIFKSKSICSRNRIRLYKTTVRILVSYRSEFWTVTARTAELLEQLESKMMRKMYGAVCKRGRWIMWKNRNLAHI